MLVRFAADLSSMDISNDRIASVKTICNFTNNIVILHCDDHSVVIADGIHYIIDDNGLIETLKLIKMREL